LPPSGNASLFACLQSPAPGAYGVLPRHIPFVHIAAGFAAPLHGFRTPAEDQSERAAAKGGSPSTEPGDVAAGGDLGGGAQIFRGWDSDGWLAGNETGVLEMAAREIGAFNFPGFLACSPFPTSISRVIISRVLSPVWPPSSVAFVSLSRDGHFIRIMIRLIDHVPHLTGHHHPICLSNRRPPSALTGLLCFPK
jgi:hypothetical protein